jgi:hypothetical protein
LFAAQIMTGWGRTSRPSSSPRRQWWTWKKKKKKKLPLQTVPLSSMHWPLADRVWYRETSLQRLKFHSIQSMHFHNFHCITSLFCWQEHALFDSEGRKLV